MACHSLWLAYDTQPGETKTKKDSHSRINTKDIQDQQQQA